MSWITKSVWHSARVRIIRGCVAPLLNDTTLTKPRARPSVASYADSSTRNDDRTCACTLVQSLRRPGIDTWRPRLSTLTFAVMAAWLVGLADQAQAQLQPQSQPQAAVECGEPQLRLSPRLIDVDPPAPRQRPIHASGQRVEGEMDRDVRLIGNAEIRQANTVLKADSIRYLPVEDELDAQGAVRLIRSGNVFEGPALRLKLGAQEGFFTMPSYALQPRIQTRVLDTNNVKLPRNFAGRGEAERADFLGPDKMLLTKATYTTCPPENKVWFIRGLELLLDSVQDEGRVKGGELVWGNTTVAKLPTMSFPLSDERRSGFLAPGLMFTSKSGPVITAPYYFNLAPNYDLTVTPKLMFRRGVQIGAWGRYIGENNMLGETRLEVLPGDQIANRTRAALMTVHRQSFDGGFGLNWNLNGVSDNNYFADFGQTIAIASQRQLIRDVTLTMSRGVNSGHLKILDWQLLQDVNAPLLRAYGWMPQLVLKQTRNDFNGFDVTLGSELTQFSHPTMDRGQRAVLTATAAYPVGGPAWQITPRVGMHATSYSRSALGSYANTQSRYPNAPLSIFSNNAGGLYDSSGARTGDSPDGYTRVLPSLSLDAGAFFERPVRFAGKAVTQTLEPRAYYVYTPYRDQSRFPVFDSARADLNFAQLFSDNRFVGHDRIADVNQLTTAVTSRLIADETGNELLRLAIGQRYYFQQTKTLLPTESAVNEASSDILLGASGRITPALSLDATVQYGIKSGRTQRAVSTVRYHPDQGKAIAATYRYGRDVIDQVDIGWQWPVAPRWYSVGRFNYSLLGKTASSTLPKGMIESLVGMEYNGDCWVFRGVLQRFTTSAGSTNSSLFFLIELNGIGRFGNNPLEALRRNIPGYSLVNSPGPVPSRFEEYQ